MSEVTEHETPEPEPEPDTPGDDDSEADEDSGAALEPEVNAAPEPQGSGITPEEAEKAFRKIETSFRTYAASVERNHPSFESDLIACLLCPPAHPGFLNVHDAGRVPREVIDAVQTFLGFAREREYRQTPNTEECATCGGEGKVENPTHVHEHKIRACPTCFGYGFLPPPTVAQNGAAAPTPTDAAIAAAVPSGPPADVDEWGEPRILPDGRANPNHGRMPAHKIAVEPWGATAGLTAQG